MSVSVNKKILKNGLTVLVKPQHNIPRVEIHMCYNVGAKDEEFGEKGITHLIEHMLFKGTKYLSESDINLISHKLLSYSNAFTSHDVTSYTFRMPSNVWEESLAIFAECMQNATFKTDLLASEIKTVIEEFGLYQEDYQNQLIEQMFAIIWPEHPYRLPVLGMKQDLCSINSEKLTAYYKKHYHPENATLIVVGDVEVEDVFIKAKKHFESIPKLKNYQKAQHYFLTDVCAKSVRLFRDIKVPWCCFAYQIPGSVSGSSYIFDTINLLLADGINSRLHKKLVNETQLAVEVGGVVYEFNEKGLLLIFVYPQNVDSVSGIEKIIIEEICKLQKIKIQKWELEAAKKRILLDYASLLEDFEKQATLIGNYFITTGDENYIDKYVKSIKSLSPNVIMNTFKKYFDIHNQHCGYLSPTDKSCAHKLCEIQRKNNELSQLLLEKFKRITPVEPGRWVNKLKPFNMQPFEFAKPTTISLSNGLDIVFYNNAQTLGISMILSFYANSNYEIQELNGIFVFLLRHLIDCTSKYTNEKLSKLLESDGVFISNSADMLTVRCLHENFENALSHLSHILTNPSFDKSSIEKIRKQILNELAEFWDTPIDFADQLAKEHIYKNHPYGKNALGTLDSVKKISVKDIRDFYKKYISPSKATLVVVGNITEIDMANVCNKYLGEWSGPEVPKFVLPKFEIPKPRLIHIPSKRDQVVLTFTAPSVSRNDRNFNALSILDIVLTGGSSFSSNSRLFSLREKYGLFYAIGGSLIYNSREAPGMMIIKTLISYDKVCFAKKVILDCLNDFGQYGIDIEEFENAKNMILSGNVENFESNIKMSSVFLFLKKFNMSTNLFDKMGDIFSIIKIDDVNRLAKAYCNSRRFSIITVGRVRS